MHDLDLDAVAVLINEMPYREVLSNFQDAVGSDESARAGKEYVLDQYTTTTEIGSPCESVISVKKI